MAKILQNGMIPHNMISFKLICVLYRFHCQTLPIMKTDPVSYVFSTTYIILQNTLGFKAEDQTICYFFLDKLVMFNEALKQCNKTFPSRNSSLAMIPTQDAQDFIVKNRNAVFNGPGK